MAEQPILNAVEDPGLAVMTPRPERGRVRVTGGDRRAFLHNMTTQDIDGLAVGHGAPAAVINQRAGLLDWIDIYAGEDAHWIVTGPGKAEADLAWWDRYLIAEDVVLEDLTNETSLLYLTGPGAAAMLPEAGRLPPYGFADLTIDGVATKLLRTHGLFGEGYHFWQGAGEPEAIQQALASRGARLIDEADAETLRLAWGLPAVGCEVVEGHNPWEARLDGAISLAKGCYLGQEVVARLNTYNKVVRYLVGLEPPVEATVGDKLLAEDKEVGTVTSARGGLALAYVKGAYAQPGTTLTLDGKPVTTRDLPFWAGKTRPVGAIGRG